MNLQELIEEEFYRMRQVLKYKTYMLSPVIEVFTAHIAFPSRPDIPTRLN